MVDEFTHDWISNGFDSIEIKMIYDILTFYDIWYFKDLCQDCIGYIILSSVHLFTILI